MKDFSGRLTAEDDAGAVVEAPLGFGDLAFCDEGKVDAFGEVFTDKAVDILDCAALPGAVGLGYALFTCQVKKSTRTSFSEAFISAISV